MNHKENRWSHEELILLKAGMLEHMLASDIADKMIRAGFRRSRNAIIVRYNRMIRAHLESEAAA